MWCASGLAALRHKTAVIPVLFYQLLRLHDAPES
jgi:hypothetical protein